jgi:transposase-like protein
VENLIMARSKTYPREVRERAVALVFEQVKTGQYGSQWEAICSVAANVGASSETLRRGQVRVEEHELFHEQPRGRVPVPAPVQLGDQPRAEPDRGGLHPRG